MAFDSPLLFRIYCRFMIFFVAVANLICFSAEWAKLPKRSVSVNTSEVDSTSNVHFLHVRSRTLEIFLTPSPHRYFGRYWRIQARDTPPSPTSLIFVCFSLKILTKQMGLLALPPLGVGTPVIVRHLS